MNTEISVERLRERNKPQDFDADIKRGGREAVGWAVTKNTTKNRWVPLNARHEYPNAQ
jgi:hypothetical protein